MSIWRSAALADRIAAAIAERGPTSATQLAKAVQARKQSVLAELRTNPTFVACGEGRETSWRLTRAGEPVPGRCEALTGVAIPPALVERLEALEQRDAELERRLAEQTAPSSHVGQFANVTVATTDVAARLDGQLDLVEEIAALNASNGDGSA